MSLFQLSSNSLVQAASSSFLSRNDSNYSSQNQTGTDTDQHSDTECSFGRLVGTEQLTNTKLLPRIQDNQLILFHPPNFTKHGTHTSLSRKQRRQRVRQFRRQDQEQLRIIMPVADTHTSEKRQALLMRIESARDVGAVFDIAREQVRQVEGARKSRHLRRPTKRINKVRGSAWKLRFGTDPDRFFESPASPTKKRSRRHIGVSKHGAEQSNQQNSRAQRQWLRLRLAHKAGVAFRAATRQRQNQKAAVIEENSILPVHLEENHVKRIPEQLEEKEEAQPEKAPSVPSKPKKKRRSSIAKGVEYIQSLILKRTQTNNVLNISTDSTGSENETGECNDTNHDVDDEESAQMPARSKQPSRALGKRWQNLKRLVARGRIKPNAADDPKKGSIDSAPFMNSNPLNSPLQNSGDDGSTGVLPISKLLLTVSAVDDVPADPSSRHNTLTGKRKERKVSEQEKVKNTTKEQKVKKTSEQQKVKNTTEEQKVKNTTKEQKDNETSTKLENVNAEETVGTTKRSMLTNKFFKGSSRSILTTSKGSKLTKSIGSSKNLLSTAKGSSRRLLTNVVGSSINTLAVSESTNVLEVDDEKQDPKQFMKQTRNSYRNMSSSFKGMIGIDETPSNASTTQLKRDGATGVVVEDEIAKKISSLLDHIQNKVRRTSTQHHILQKNSNHFDIQRSKSSRDRSNEMETNGFVLDLCKDRAVATRCSETKKLKKERLLREMAKAVNRSSSSGSVISK